MNKVILIGRLVREPELKEIPNGTAVLQNAIAVNRKFKNQNGEFEADFINFVAFGATATLIGRYVKKGHLLGLEGRIQTRSYQAQDGTNRYVTEVIVDSMDFLQGKSDNQAQQGDPFENVENQFDIADEDLPF